MPLRKSEERPVLFLFVLLFLILPPPPLYCVLHLHLYFIGFRRRPYCRRPGSAKSFRCGSQTIGLYGVSPVIMNMALPSFLSSFAHSLPSHSNISIFLTAGASIPRRVHRGPRHGRCVVGRRFSLGVASSMLPTLRIDGDTNTGNDRKGRTRSQKQLQFLLPQTRETDDQAE